MWNFRESFWFTCFFFTLCSKGKSTNSRVGIIVECIRHQGGGLKGWGTLASASLLFCDGKSITWTQKNTNHQERHTKWQSTGSITELDDALCLSKYRCINRASINTCPTHILKPSAGLIDASFVDWFHYFISKEETCLCSASVSKCCRCRRVQSVMGSGLNSGLWSGL